MRGMQETGFPGGKTFSSQGGPVTDQPRRPNPPPSKPGPPAGISATDFSALKAKVSDLERQLQEALAERNQWNSVLRKWQDSGAVVKFRLQGCTDELICGKILWIDRYTIGIAALKASNPFEIPADPVGEEPTIIHKGAIVTVTV